MQLTLVSSSLIRPAFAALLISALFACATGVKVEQIPPTADASQEISVLEADVNQARTAQVDALSPTWFSRAQTQLTKAKEARADGDDAKDVLGYVAQGKAYLRKANEVAPAARTAAAGVDQARQAALDANAATLVPEQFGKAERQFKDVTEEAEDGDLSDAKSEAPAIAALYRASELSAIKEAQLGHAARQIRTATDEGAAKMAPQSLSQAQNRLSLAMRTIEQDRYNKTAIGAAVADANQAADLLLKITRDTKVADNKKPEQIALDQYKKDQALTQANQSAMAANQASEGKDYQLARQKGQLSSLEAQAELERKFKKVREQFSEQEAEVYKEGDHVLIRLKGIEFPKNSAVIREEAYPLMSKVNAAIQQFDAGKVSIEGHTDSTGAAALNRILSEKRAKSVASYLTENGVVDASRIVATGFGYEKPVASNKSAAGRAQNRRIDVILQ